jgi:hypothetical protein
MEGMDEIQEEDPRVATEGFSSPAADRPTPSSGTSKLKLSRTELGLDLKGSSGVTGFKLFLFENDASTPICKGYVGTKREKFCRLHPSECRVGSHGVKAPVREGTIYIARSEGVGLLQPSLDLQMAEKSAVFALHGGNSHPVVTWRAIFDCIETTAGAVSLSSPYLTEQDSKELVKESLRLSNPTPKRVRLVKETSWKDAQEMDLEACALASKEAFERTEAELTSLHTQLTIVASLTGRPKKDDNAGSAWSAIERSDDRLDRVDADLSGVKKVTDSQSGHLGLLAAHVTGLSSMAGPTGKVARLEAQVRELTDKNSTLTEDVTRLVSALEEIVAFQVGGQSLKYGPSRTESSRIEAVETSLSKQISDLKGLVSGSGVVRFGKWHLDGVDSCRAILTRSGLSRAAYEYVVDLPHLLAMVQPPTRSHADIHDETVLESKSKLSIEKMLAIASIETLIPEILAGTSSNRTDLLHDFGSMKSAIMWDALDGTHGTKNYISTAVDHLRDGFLHRLSSEFEWEHQEFFHFCELAFQRSVVELEEFCIEVSDFNRALLARAHGEPPYTKDQEREVWPLVLIFPMVYWEEVAKVRSSAKRIKTMDPTTATASMMWAAVQAHAKHAEFKSARFREHPRINPKVLSYLFERCANKREVVSLKAAQTSAATTMGSLKASIDQLKVQMDRLASKVGGNGGGGGGAGGGHDGGGGYNRNKKRFGQRAGDAEHGGSPAPREG